MKNPKIRIIPEIITNERGKTRPVLTFYLELIQFKNGLSTLISVKYHEMKLDHFSLYLCTLQNGDAFSFHLTDEMWKNAKFIIETGSECYLRENRNFNGVFTLNDCMQYEFPVDCINSIRVIA